MLFAKVTAEKELIGTEVAFSNHLPGFESFVLSVCFIQCKATYLEAQAADAFIKYISFFLSFLLLFFCQVGIKEAQMWHVCYKKIEEVFVNCQFVTTE